MLAAEEDRIAMQVASSGSDQTYGWSGQFPQLREWLGPRFVNSLAAHSFKIVNRDFESTVSVSRNHIMDDKLGVFKPAFSEMGRLARTHPEELVFNLLASGFETECHDGQYFFDTDHPVQDETGATVESGSNMQAGGGPAWFLLDTSRAVRPIIFQEREGYQFTSLDKPEDHNVFMNREFIYGVHARVNAGFGLWQQGEARQHQLCGSAGSDDELPQRPQAHPRRRHQPVARHGRAHRHALSRGLTPWRRSRSPSTPLRWPHRGARRPRLRPERSARPAVSSGWKRPRSTVELRTGVLCWTCLSADLPGIQPGDWHSGECPGEIERRGAKALGAGVFTAPRTRRPKRPRDPNPVCRCCREDRANAGDDRTAPQPERPITDDPNPYAIPPATVRPYVEALGVETAIDFLMEFGGGELYFSETPNGRGMVERAVGVEKARLLASLLPGLKVRVPLANRWVARCLHVRGASVADIAQRMRKSDITVRKYVQGQNLPRQAWKGAP